jgi:hypothetical protein
MDPLLLAQQRRNAAINGADDAYNNTVSTLRRAAVAATIAAGVGTHHWLMQSGALVPPPSTRPRFPSRSPLMPGIVSPSAFRTSPELMMAQLSAVTRGSIGKMPPVASYYDFRARALWLDDIRAQALAHKAALSKLRESSVVDYIRLWGSNVDSVLDRFESNWVKAGGRSGVSLVVACRHVVAKLQHTDVFCGDSGFEGCFG